MKPDNDIRRAMRARFNQAKKHLAEIGTIVKADPDEIQPGEIGDLRNNAEQLLQCIHEFSAYWNVWKT